MVWPFAIYRVEGDSMLPSYSHGDTLLGIKWFKPAVGQVVVANGPERMLIKRIIGTTGLTAWLEGDNSKHSTDSRSFGPLPLSSVVAKVIIKL